jgi:hypothetical protein
MGGVACWNGWDMDIDYDWSWGFEVRGKLTIMTIGVVWCATVT